MENSNDKILVAVIANVHGIKGEVKIKSFTEPADNFASYSPLTDKSGKKTFKIKVLGEANGVFRARIEGVNDRNDAEAIKGIELFADKSHLKDLDDEEFYHNDLVDCKVTFLDGEKIGFVSAIYNFGAGDILEVTTFADKQIMVPFTKAFVPVVDIKNRLVKVERTPGLFEEADEDEDDEDKDEP